MFHLVSGPFQPVLESSLVKEIQELKSADPFTPLAIVVPSEILRQRAQWLLCVDHGLALFDVHFLTFHQLALRLYDEQVHTVGQESSLSCELVSDLVCRQLLREILGRDIPAFKSLSRLRESPGLCAALWATIRDLNEAMIDPTAVLLGLDEGVFGEDPQGSLRTLLSLQVRMQEEMKMLQIGNAEDLAQMVIPWVMDSHYLARLSHVCYYGFYDLSQVQLSLFDAVTQKIAVTAYVPLIDDPAFAFAQRFHDRYLSSGLAVKQPVVSSGETEYSSSMTHQPSIKMMNAVGVEDELTIVCKEIGNLVELHGYNFDEIGVVARVLEPYQPWVRRAFDQHRIPFTSSAVMPMIHEPVIKVLLQLGGLVSNRFSRKDIFDVLKSPYFRMDRLTDRPDLVQPDLWEKRVHQFGITRGEEQWGRLSVLLHSDHEASSGWGRGHRKSARQQVSAESMQLFDRCIHALMADCRALPTSGCIEQLSEAFLSLIRSYLLVPGLETEEAHDEQTSLQIDPGSSHEMVIAEGIQSLCSLLKQLYVLHDTMTWDEWMDLLRNLVEEVSLPLEPGPHRGIRVLDAMTARGLPFRALFVLGLNEKVFPRFIREDAFLRDIHRRVLAETLGYKIDEKLSGYDEEQLLFSLIRQAAKDRLYLSYQRAEETGRLLAPSSFLREFNRESMQADVAPVFSLPRRFSDRLDDSLFRDSLLTGEEFGLKLILRGMNPSILLEHLGRESSIFQQGWNALECLERDTRELGECDGILGSLDSYWQSLISKGISPTALEGYARCPFQYYASHVLGIPTARNQMTDELSPSVVGMLCHAVLHQVYIRLIHVGWPQGQITSQGLESMIASTLDDACAEYMYEHAIGYRVLWDLLRDKVKTLVIAEIEASREEYLRSGFRPVAVEVDATGQMELPGVFSDVKIYGRLDRVDGNRETGDFRIIDYKLKMSAKMKSEERDLLVSGIRGTFLQPPVYSLMSEFRVQTEEGDVHNPLYPERVEFVYLAPHRSDMVRRSVFTRATWEASAGQQLRKTMGDLLLGMKNGQHYILPGQYCESCSLESACRRFHEPTMSRSYRSLPAKQLRAMRRQVPND